MEKQPTPNRYTIITPSGETLDLAQMLTDLRADVLEAVFQHGEDGLDTLERQINGVLNYYFDLIEAPHLTRSLESPGQVSDASSSPGIDS